MFSLLGCNPFSFYMNGDTGYKAFSNWKYLKTFSQLWKFQYLNINYNNTGNHWQFPLYHFFYMEYFQNAA